MQSLNDDERRDILGSVLADELRAIREYVEDIPALKQQLHQVQATVDDIDAKVTVLEHVSRDHKTELQQLKAKLA